MWLCVVDLGPAPLADDLMYSIMGITVLSNYMLLECSSAIVSTFHCLIFRNVVTRYMSHTLLARSLAVFGK